MSSGGGGGAADDQPREWDAAVYDQFSTAMTTWGEEVVGRLKLSGSERVLDAGCGTGRVTEMLVELVPRGEVLAVDGSAAMVKQARKRLGSRAEVFVADLRELELAEPVDVIVSTATFHWIVDHSRLFTRLFAVLKPGGQLVAQCGGEGNLSKIYGAIERVREREQFAPYFKSFHNPKLYAGPDDTKRRLEAAGFIDARCWLEPRPTLVPDPATYIQNLQLKPYLEQLPPEMRGEMVQDVVSELADHRASTDTPPGSLSLQGSQRSTSPAQSSPPLEFDYVRLNIEARRP